jgi:hypothetical protein
MKRMPLSEPTRVGTTSFLTLGRDPPNLWPLPGCLLADDSEKTVPLHSGKASRNNGFHVPNCSFAMTGIRPRMSRHLGKLLKWRKSAAGPAKRPEIAEKPRYSKGWLAVEASAFKMKIEPLDVVRRISARRGAVWGTQLIFRGAGMVLPVSDNGIGLCGRVWQGT